jgi:acyl-CoA synthetase (AMP-forming)/AMP-acid ligase II
MIFQSPHVEIPVPAVPFQEFVLHQATKLGVIPAMIEAETGRTITYRDLARDVCQFATAIAARGMRKGDVFAVMLPNQPEFATAFYGVLAAGGVITTLNPLYTGAEIARQLEDSGARYLLTLPQLIDKALEAATKQQLREIFVVGEAPGATPFSALLATDCTPPRIHVNPLEDLAVLPYSSGTTGRPKGVMLTHANLTAAVLSMTVDLPFGAGRVWLAILPFFHVAGMVCLLHTAIYAGGTLVLMRRFDMEVLLRSIQNYRIEVAELVPPIVAALAKYPSLGKHDLSSLKLLTSGAAPLTADMERACEERLRIPLVQGYGMTETSSATHGSWEPQNSKPGSVRPCSPNVQCRIVDSLSGAQLGVREMGNSGFAVRKS